MTTEMELTLDNPHKVSGWVIVMEVSFDDSNTLVLERFDTSAGNPVKEILPKLNLPDHRCSRAHSRQSKEQAQDLKSMITTSIHKLVIEAKDYELKTKVKA
ncbi:hypothetical protein Tco_0167753 [Tanacetum coccineum]